MLEKKTKHATIPVFVPHLACPNRCVFCNQKRISGAETVPLDPYPVLKAAASGLSPKFTEVDIAFFGGSFTGIPRETMISYLSAAVRVRDEFPHITGIRLSTRPDYIDEEVLSVLSSYGVTAVELGVQSLNDKVLALSGRGHTAEDTRQAVSLLKRFPFETVLQLMPGLPGDTRQTIFDTARSAAELKPDSVRIYPCVVLRDTPLCEAYLRKEFVPLPLGEAVEICADLVTFFREKQIKILRVGLHASDLVQNSGVVAGPFHPAFGELTEQTIYYRKIVSLLEKDRPAVAKRVRILVAPGEVSKAVGQKRGNLTALRERFGLDCFVSVTDLLSPGQVQILWDSPVFFESSDKRR